MTVLAAANIPAPFPENLETASSAWFNEYMTIRLTLTKEMWLQKEKKDEVKKISLDISMVICIWTNYSITSLCSSSAFKPSLEVASRKVETPK